MSSPEPRRRLLWCLAALAGMWLQLAPGVEGATGQAGNVLQVSTSSTAADLTLEQGVVARVEFLADDIVRVRLNPYGSLSRVPTGAVISSAIAPTAVQFLDSPEALLMQSPRAVVAVRKQPFQVIVLRSDQSVVTEDVPGGIVWNTETGQIAIKKVAHAGEAYFGLGARGGPINRRGRVIAMHNADSPGYGEFTDPLYISIPFFYGLWNGQAYGLFFDNPADTLFDLDQGNTGVLTLGASAGEIDYYVLTGPTP
ncbi:MAG TPA: hypothetical protein VNN17_06530, partial [Terriglobia bacterium]|nr:hypothetical protein [Terriglobia bacterium]